MEKEYQAEFFEEFKDKESRLKYIAKKIIPRQRPTVLHLSLEAVILYIILILLGVIISFAVGVETGKRKAALPVSAAKKVIDRINKTREPLIQGKARNPAIKTNQSAVADDRTAYKAYTIQVLSSKDKNAALAKSKELKQAGYNATVLYNDGLYQVCAGAYMTREEAGKEVLKLQSKFKGCFVKTR